LWAWNVAIEKTGGYLYQRILLAVINSSLMLIVMLLTGIPFAVPLAVFTGFTAAFIPIVGTYLAGIVPIVVALAAAGPARATILLAWIVIYQQLENYLLEPRLSKQTMDLNPGIALGAALAGGSVGGLIGAAYRGGDPGVHHDVCHPVRGRGHGADEGRRGGPAGVGLAVTGGRRPGPLTESASFADDDPKRGHSGVSWQGASEPRARDHRASLIPLPRRTYGQARPRRRTHAGRRGR